MESTCNTNSSIVDNTLINPNISQKGKLNFHVGGPNCTTTLSNIMNSPTNQTTSESQMSTKTSTSPTLNEDSQHRMTVNSNTINDIFPNNINVTKSPTSETRQPKMHGDLQRKLTSTINPSCSPPNTMQTKSIETVHNNHENESLSSPDPKCKNIINASKTYHPHKYESIKLNSKAQCVSFSLDKISYHAIPSSKKDNEIFTYKDALIHSRAFPHNLQSQDKSRKMWNTLSILKRSRKLVA